MKNRKLIYSSILVVYACRSRVQPGCPKRPISWGRAVWSYYRGQRSAGRRDSRRRRQCHSAAACRQQ